MTFAGLLGLGERMRERLINYNKLAGYIVVVYCVVVSVIGCFVSIIASCCFYIMFLAGCRG